MAETTCHGEASGVAGQARGAERVRPDRRNGGHASTSPAYSDEQQATERERSDRSAVILADHPRC
jgi:hypothetical protein